MRLSRQPIIPRGKAGKRLAAQAISHVPSKMRDEAQMRPRTSLTARTRTIETDRIQQLLPIDRIKPAVLGRIGITTI